MYSGLKDFLYTDLSRDITEQDEDHEASEWVYSDKTVFRGALDVSYREYGLDVFSLYNDDSERVGIAEHSADNRAEFKVLWFHDNPWNTLFQEEWKQDGTIFSKLSAEAYQDSIDDDLLLLGHKRLVLPEYIYKGFPDVYECSCSLSFSQTKPCQTKKKVHVTEPIFIDESFITYIPPANSKVWSKLGLQRVSSFGEQVEHLQQLQVEIQEPQLLVTPLLEELPQRS
jgi:hypothetical protein